MNKENFVSWVSATILLLIAVSAELYGAEKIEFERIKESFPACIQKIGGEIIDAVKWVDQTGENLIVITENKEGQSLEPGYASELYAAQFKIKNSGCDTVWDIRDFNYIDSEVSYIKGSLEIVDVDNDGVAENMFFYTIVSADRQTIKAMMHTNGEKLAIRGFWDIDIDYEEPLLDTIMIDSTFSSYPEAFKNYALEEWKKTVGDN